MGPPSGELKGSVAFTVAQEDSVRLRCTSMNEHGLRLAAMVGTPTWLGWGALAGALALGDDHRARPT